MADTSTHIVKLYDSDKNLSDDLIKHFGSSKVSLAIATRENISAFKKSLDGNYRENQIIFLDAVGTLSECMTGGKVDKKNFEKVIGKVLKNTGNGSSVKIYCEMVAILWAQGKKDQAIKLERLWNGLCKKYSFDLFCAQPIKSIDNKINHLSIRDINEIVEEHSNTFII